MHKSRIPDDAREKRYVLLDVLPREGYEDEGNREPLSLAGYGLIGAVLLMQPKGACFPVFLTIIFLVPDNGRIKTR